MTTKSAKKAAAPKKVAKAAVRRGKMVRLMTLDERLEDMRAYGREVRETKQSALDFLRRAGIIDVSGQVAEPFRN
jgi:hypothetical protein